MTLPSPTAWIFAFWIVTAVLGAPLLLGALFGSRWPLAQRRIVRVILAAAPAVLIVGLLLPDPFEGRPLWRIDRGAESPLADSDPRDPGFDREPLPFETAAISPFAETPHVAEATEPEARKLRSTGEGARGETTPHFGGERARRSELETRAAREARAAQKTQVRSPRLPRGRARGPGDHSHGEAPTASPRLPRVQETEAIPADPSGSTTSAPHPAPWVPWVPSAAQPATFPALDSIRHPTATAPPVARPAVEGRTFHPTRAVAPTPPPRETPLFAPGFIARSLLFVWAIGAGLGVVRLISGLMTLTRWRSRTRAIGNTRGVPLVDRVLGDLPVRVIPGLGSAAAVGVLSPEIWLPAHWSARLDKASLHALLGHEAAHHLGRDPLWRIIAAAIAALLWPHPLVHALRRREECLCELVADRHVLAAGAGPRRYATLLADLATDSTRVPVALAAGVIGTRSPLERRIRIDPVHSPGTRRP